MGRVGVHPQERDGAIDLRSETGGDEEAAAGHGDASAEDWGEVDGLEIGLSRGSQYPHPLAENARRVGHPVALSVIRAELVHDSRDVVVLEEADGGDARGSGFEAGAGVGESDTAEGQHGDG